MISEIAAASQEQARGISQISQGINQIDQVTQQNTASAQQSAAASEELASQAIQLKDMMVKFKLRRQNLTHHTQLGTSEMMYHKNHSPMRKESSQAATRGIVKGKAGIRPEQVISFDDKDYGKF